ncbi:hypothetical protein EJD97_025850 [Solanum chilense]|uniref:Uncharacterized protein n=1 Tax=Solanum chilense TaxID=4083 RepID=A0A6N2BZT4_SOLCI|nr:hypothetical protein EJD97_025850 [Solanum chilense]
MATKNSFYFLILFFIIALNFINTLATYHNSDDNNTEKWLHIWPFVPPPPQPPSSIGHFPKFPFTRSSIFPWPRFLPPYSPTNKKTSDDISMINSQNVLKKKSCASVVERCIICDRRRCFFSYDCCEIFSEFGHEGCNKVYGYAMIKNHCAISPLAAPPPST